MCGVLVPRLHTHMAMPTMHAQTTNRPLTAISTNQVRSRPKNRAGSWLWQRVPIASSLPSAQWLTPSHTRFGWMQNAAKVHRKSLQACSVGETDIHLVVLCSAGQMKHTLTGILDCRYNHLETICIGTPAIGHVLEGNKVRSCVQGPHRLFGIAAGQVSLVYKRYLNDNY